MYSLPIAGDCVTGDGEITLLMASISAPLKGYPKYEKGRTYYYGCESTSNNTSAWLINSHFSFLDCDKSFITSISWFCPLGQYITMISVFACYFASCGNTHDLCKYLDMPSGVWCNCVLSSTCQSSLYYLCSVCIGWCCK